MKALYYGDNLQVLRDSIATESVDLIYLDPPFMSIATYYTYNVRCWRQSRHLVHRLIRSVHEDRKFANVFKLLESDWVNHPSVSVH